MNEMTDEREIKHELQRTNADSRRHGCRQKKLPVMERLINL